MIPLLLFGGFFLSNGAVPVYFEWLRYISWFMYANEALSINQWTGVSFNDTNSPCPNHICTDEYILNQYEFNPVMFLLFISESHFSNSFVQDYFYRNIGCLIALIAGFRILGFFALLKKTYRRN